ncbi:MAG: hypothetical protein IJN41_04060, partial [Firmicutes bacterium]|nr:hypothetical protein [Bacillota bacterium]
TPKTYTVVIDGEMNQTISVNDRSVDLFAHAESGYYYNYFIDGISKKVEEDTDYTFTVDQIRRLFTNGSYEIVREEVNVGEKTFTDWLDNLNDTIGREAFTVTGTTLTGEIGMSDMMNMVMGMMGGYSYIGLNDEGLLYMNADNATEVSLQTLVNAMLSDENFTEQTLIDLADNNGGTLVTTTIQLGDDEDNLAKDLTFVIKLTSVPPQMDNVAGLLKTLKGYMGFQAVDGTLAVTAEMPEKFYDVYLTALTLTGKVDLTDLNAVETEIAYTFLADYVKILTGEGVDATTYVNTLKKLGKEDLLAGYETYINELLGMLGNSFTYDKENENYALSLTASKELLEKILAIFGGDNLGSVTGLIKEMKDGGALIIPLTAEVTNFNDDNAEQNLYEAFIVNQGALGNSGTGKLEVVNISTDLAADLAKSSGFNVVILQKDLGDDEHPVDLVIDADTNAYLDLNGKIITGNVTVNGQLTLIDSTFDTANAGGINGELFGNNISVIAGKYTTDVAKWLKSGYVQAEGA